jgi:hypothetical protein
MKRDEMIDKVIELSGEEFESRFDLIELAKKTDDQLVKMIIHINNYILQNR